jgi:hypothetical protein
MKPSVTIERRLVALTYARGQMTATEQTHVEKNLRMA